MHNAKKMVQRCGSNQGWLLSYTRGSYYYPKEKKNYWI